MLEPVLEFLGLSTPPATPPVIGISGGNADSASVRAMMTQIQSAGAIPLFLGNHAKRDAAADIEKIDALIVMGNNADIDPERYGQAKHEKTVCESATPEGKARADYEYALMQEAMDSGMPLLGVCGGMQRLNVMLGGTLNQHIPDITGNDDHAQQLHNIAPFTPVQVVAIAPGTTLSGISSHVSAVYTPTHSAKPLAAILENSMHHQAVERVGNGLRASGYAVENDKDGNQTQIVEAIEADPQGKYGRQFMLGLQWHPEFSASPLGACVATRLASEAQHFARAHNRNHPMHQAVDENMLSQLPLVKIQDPARTAPGGITERILQERRAAQQDTQLSA